MDTNAGPVKGHLSRTPIKFDRNEWQWKHESFYDWKVRTGQIKAPKKGKKKKPPHINLRIQMKAIRNLIVMRAAWLIPDDECTEILVEQLFLRTKICMKGDREPEHMRWTAMNFVRQFMPWYDCEAFPWYGDDNLTLLYGEAFGNAVNLSAREEYFMKGKGDHGFIPVDRGQDALVKEYRKEDEEIADFLRKDALKDKRDEARTTLQRAVSVFRKDGRSHADITKIFNAELRKNVDGRSVKWTGRMIVSLDTELDKAEHKRKVDANRKRREREEYHMTKREMKVIENDNTRDLIVYLYNEECMGYGTIARVLNERKIPTRTGKAGAKWNRSMVKRELIAAGVVGRTQNVTLSTRQSLLVEGHGGNALQ